MHGWTNSSSVEILIIHEDYFGPFARIRVELLDGSIDIRWGLDRYTYEHLRKVADFGAKANYQCRLLLKSISSHAASGHVGSLMSQVGTQWVRLEFSCSKLFVSNLEWLRGVRSVNELRSLAWDRWIESEYGLKYAEDIAIETVSFTRVHDRQPVTPKFMRRLFGISIIFVIVVGGVILFASLRQSALRDPLKSLPVHASPSDSEVSANTPTVVSSQKAPRSSTRPITSVENGHSNSGAPHSTPATVGSSGVQEVYSVPGGEVALTFSGGPSPYTERIVQELNQYHIHATFFFIGHKVLGALDVVKYVEKQGEGIGGQTVDYPNLTTESASEQEREIVGGMQIIDRYVKTPVVLFRPPYDSFNQTTDHIIAQHHLVLALWNRDPRSWAATSPQQVVQRVLSDTASGGVFELQDDKNTMIALPTILKKFKSYHLKFVVLSPETTSIQ